MLALWSFGPRRYPSLNPGRLRQYQYLAADEAFTKLRLFDTLAAMISYTRAVVLRRKIRRLKAATAALSLSLALFGAGIVDARATGGAADVGRTATTIPPGGPVSPARS